MINFSFALNTTGLHFHTDEHRRFISIVKPTRCTNASNSFYFEMTLNMFWTVFPSIVRSSRLYMYSNRHLSNRYCCLLASIPTSKQTAVSVWHMPLAVCTVLNSRWWTERPPKTCRVSYQNKINLIQWCIWLILLHKYTTMHGPMNVKKTEALLSCSSIFGLYTGWKERTNNCPDDNKTKPTLLLLCSF